MKQIDRLIIKARNKAEPTLKPYERAVLNNPYRNQGHSELLELLSAPMDDWRWIVQAMAWKGGG